MPQFPISDPDAADILGNKTAQTVFKDRSAEVIARISKNLEGNAGSQAVFTRLLAKIDEILVPDLCEDKILVQELLSTTDDEFLQSLLIRVRLNNARSDREAEKIRKREQANRKFFDKLKANGGLFKVGQVAPMLNVSRQAVAKQRDAGKIIFLRSGHDFSFPGFQFRDGKKLPHLEDILCLLPDRLSATAQCSFFLNEMQMPDGTTQSPATVLATIPLNLELVNYIKLQASLFGRHIAK
ncbi:hypothetical protein [Rheinheimera fenheensis]|uniref:hypothetical protein n=1 Tax=Rheinheimera fenheensis TaxID=3152295 RepID=UPI00325F18C2